MALAVAVRAGMLVGFPQEHQEFSNYRIACRDRTGTFLEISGVIDVRQFHTKCSCVLFMPELDAPLLLLT